MKEKLLILYGAGFVGESIVKKCRKLCIHLECLCDADPKKTGTNISGVIVKSIEEVLSQYKKGEYLIFVSILPANALTVKNELIKCGVFDDSDFCCEDTFEKLAVRLIPKKEPRNISDFYTSVTECNFISLSDTQDKTLRELLLNTMFSNECYRCTEQGKRDFHEHLYGRLNMFRSRLIPWLESIRPIKDSKILEIGCGTGSTTVPLCEQGADLIAVDINEQSLEIARKRLEIYGLQAIVEKVDAVDIEMSFSSTQGFDLIIYSASMEHMTYNERIRTIKAAYNMIGDNQYIVLANVPNRLWHTDGHTSLEPFFNWLPDDLAMEYARLTEREGFNLGFDYDSADGIQKLYRWGRGVSYHEFEVAVGRGMLRVVSDMDSFFDISDELYKTCLKINGPDHLQDGFYSPSLNMALEKVKKVV